MKRIFIIAVLVVMFGALSSSAFARGRYSYRSGRRYSRSHRSTYYRTSYRSRRSYRRYRTTYYRVRPSYRRVRVYYYRPVVYYDYYDAPVRVYYYYSY